MRIASFLPSATEMLFAIGAGPQVCAVTFECDWPPEAQQLPQVVHSHMPQGLSQAEIDALVRSEGAAGRSLYFVEMERLEALAPDVVVLQDLCRVCAVDSPTLARDMSRLPSRPRVVSLNAHTLEGVLGEMEMLGEVCGRVPEARAVTDGLRRRLAAVRSQGAKRSGVRPRVLCLEWLEPMFQGGHWVPEMVEAAGGEAVLAEAGEKSRVITWEEVQAADPDVIVLMPCGYHLRGTLEHIAATRWPAGWEQLKAVRNGEVYAVDGSAYFSRPGPRLVEGAEILLAILSGEGWEVLPKDRAMRLP